MRGSTDVSWEKESRDFTEDLRSETQLLERRVM